MIPPKGATSVEISPVFKPTMGVALANGFLVSEDLAEGKLIKIVPEAEPMDEARIGAYFFRYSKKKSGDAKIIQFHKWLSKLIQSA